VVLAFFKVTTLVKYQQNFIQHFLSRFTLFADEIFGDHQYGFQQNRSKTCQTDIYSAFIKYLRKNGNTMRQFISYLWTSRKPMIQLGESLYNILIEFSIPKKLVRLIKLC
jgi:hypothetical protein